MCFGAYIRGVSNPIKVSRGEEAWNACMEPGLKFEGQLELTRQRTPEHYKRYVQSSMGGRGKESLIWGDDEEWAWQLSRKASQGCLSLSKIITRRLSYGHRYVGDGVGKVLECQFQTEVTLLGIILRSGILGPIRQQQDCICWQ